MKFKNNGVTVIMVGLMVLSTGCAATRTGSMAAAPDTTNPAVVTNEQPLGKDYGAVNRTTAKQPPAALDETNTGQSPDNGMPPSTSHTTSDPVNQ